MEIDSTLQGCNSSHSAAVVVQKSTNQSEVPQPNEHEISNDIEIEDEHEEVLTIKDSSSSESEESENDSLNDDAGMSNFKQKMKPK